MSYDRCPICDSYKIEYTGVCHQSAYETICHNCGWHGASSWEPLIAPYQCTAIGKAIRNYIQQYSQELYSKEIAYIKGLQSNACNHDENVV